MFSDLSQIIPLIASLLILVSFFVQIFLFCKKYRKRKDSVPPPSAAKDFPLIITFTFNGDSTCNANVDMHIDHLDIQRHKNFLIVLQEILDRERLRHEKLKKEKKNKFQLIEFKKDDENG